MSWYADLASKAENLLTNIDEKTAGALRSQNVLRSRKYERPTNVTHTDPASKRRPSPVPRPMRRNSVELKPIHVLPNRKGSPPSHFSTINTQEHMKPSTKGRRPSIKNIHNLDTARSVVGDFSDAYGLKGRRCPPDHQDLMDSEDFTYRFENLEVENAMMKNEMNVLNKEMAALIEKLHVTETELDEKDTKLKNVEDQYAKLSSEKEELTCKLDKSQSKVKSITELEEKIKDLCDKNAELENMVVQLNEKHNETIAAQQKVEAELRHANNIIKELKANLTTSNNECKRLESDWASYKHRVKNMLSAKDTEILALQSCRFTEDKTALMEQIDQLRDEREVLSSAVNRVRAEYENMKQYMDSLEIKYATAERVVSAMRDALREERAARNRAEAQCGALSKELKAIQIETGQTIASLRTALRDKDHELSLAKDTASSARSSDTSALNVADYDVSEMNFNKEKVHHLSQKLVSNQEKFESLLTENNTLKIQLEKLENISKSRSGTNNENVVHLKERLHLLNKSSIALNLSRKISHITRTYPRLCVLILIYMVGLHLWVFTVLLSSTSNLLETADTY